MTVKRGAMPTSSNADGRQPPLPFKCPMGTVKVYWSGQKVFNTKAGPVEKTVIHYEKNGTRFAYASNREDVVADLAELTRAMTKADGKQTSIEANFLFVKDGELTLTFA